MLNLQKEKLALVVGGCHCYCLEYPYSALKIWPFVWIGKKETQIVCEESCVLEGNKERGYYGFGFCPERRRKEPQPSPEYREFINRVLKGRENSKQWEDNLF